MKVLITGGAGFIGCNAAKRFMDRGDTVVIIDDLSRKGADLNLRWLREQGEFTFYKTDVRNFGKIAEAFREEKEINLILHLAAQVAVTTSVTNPRADFEVNALGTFNMLEAARRSQGKPVFLYASTNKVYGGMTDIGIAERNGRYCYKDTACGIAEDRPLDFHSPYGCSKGTGDQYTIDYSRIYGIHTVCMRQSCIYGTRQFGVEDQGWVAWFVIAAVLGRPITIYGDGKQVRDVLYVDDLIDCYISAFDNIGKAKGRAYNVGGGTDNTMSLMELISLLEEVLNKKINYTFSDWRPGDQPVFICNTKRAQEELGWKPNIQPKDGVLRLIKWVEENKASIAPAFA